MYSCLGSIPFSRWEGGGISSYPTPAWLQFFPSSFFLVLVLKYDLTLCTVKVWGQGQCPYLSLEIFFFFSEIVCFVLLYLDLFSVSLQLYISHRCKKSSRLKRWVCLVFLFSLSFFSHLWQFFSVFSVCHKFIFQKFLHWLTEAVHVLFSHEIGT